MKDEDKTKKELVTELKKLRRRIALLESKEKKRRWAEETFRLTQFSVDQAAEAIFWLDRDAKFFYVNRKACRALGYSREELLTMKVHDIDPKFPKKIWKEHWKKVRQKGSCIAESCHRRKNGTVFPVELIINHIQFDNKEFHCTFARDITEQKQAENEIKQKAERLKILYELGEKTSSIISREKLLPWIARRAAKLLQADVCNYRIREGDYLVKGGGTKEGMKLMVKERVKIGESVSGIIAKKKRHLVIENIAEKDPWHIKEHNEMAQKLGYISFLGVPMMIGDDVIGVIHVYTKKPRIFTKKDIELLSAFAGHAAIAIENSRLYEEAVERASQFKVLYEVNKKIASELRKESLLHWIARQAVKLLQADVCNYRIREGDYLVRGSGTKEGLELMKKEKLRIGESLSGLIAKKKRPLIISDDYSNDQRLIPEHRERAKKYGYRSALGVPMLIEGEVIGVLIVTSKKKREFTKKDIELLSAFADQAAIAIHNSKLFEDLENAKEELERWNKRLESMVEERTKKLMKIQSQLVHSEGLAATGRLAGSIAHEINNPLQAIDSFVSSIINDIEDKESKSVEYLKLAQEGILRIANIVKQLLAFHRPEEEGRNLEDINSIIRKTLSLTKNQLSLNKIRVREELCPDLPMIRVSAQQIHQVLLNLILNAQDAMPEGGELRIRTAKNKKFISIEVSDTGVGIPKDFMSRIFEPFSTTKKGEKGTGLGLSISYGIIKAHSGDIEVKSKEREGTTFTVILPIHNH